MDYRFEDDGGTPAWRRRHLTIDARKPGIRAAIGRMSVWKLLVLVFLIFGLLPAYILIFGLIWAYNLTWMFGG